MRKIGSVRGQVGNPLRFTLKGGEMDESIDPNRRASFHSGSQLDIVFGQRLFNPRLQSLTIRP